MHVGEFQMRYIERNKKTNLNRQLNEGDEESLRRNSRYPKRNIKTKIYEDKEAPRQDQLFCKYLFKPIYVQFIFDKLRLK